MEQHFCNTLQHINKTIEFNFYNKMIEIGF